MAFWRKRVVVKDGERAIVTRNGRFTRVLEPGSHTMFDFGGKLAIELVRVARAEFAEDRYALLEKSHPRIAAALFEVVRTNSDQAAIVSFDGKPMHVLGPWQTRVFWKVATKVDVLRFDAAADARVPQAALDQLEFGKTTTLYVNAVVEAHEAALVFFDGKLEGRLPPGRHAFWTIGRAVRIARFDLRPQLLEITAQEILTKDKISLRVTLSAFYSIVDPEKSAAAATDLPAALYRLVQFAVREAIATRTLDDILSARDKIDGELRHFLDLRAADLGVTIGELGIKDVILPGEIRELLNKVVEAERLAKANLIRRQEETAATRSLLNTAKLMEDNPTLLRLKELETLERLVEKVGKIDLHASNGAGFDTLLDGLLKQRPTST